MISSVMALKFVNHRWLENIPVAERVISVWDSVQQFVQKVDSKEIPKPDNKSYKTIKEAVKDRLVLAKLEFFCSVAKLLQSFLTKLQTDRPVTPFLCTDLTSVIRSLMRKFIRPSCLDDADTPEKLLRIDIEDSSNHLTYSKIEIGFKAETKLKEVKVSERQIMEYRVQCKDFLINTLKKMKEKCPVVHSLVRNMASPNPLEMTNNKVLARERFKKVIRSLLSTKTLEEADAEDVIQQYDEFLDNIPVIGSDKFTSFNQYSDRIDSFLLGHMASARFEKLKKKTVKLLLILSHGQATVEQGFSVNKEVECENMKEKTLVSQRLIYDHVKQVDGVLNVPITNKLLVSAASARQKFETYLELQRQQKKSALEQRKRKSTLEEIEEIKKREKSKLRRIMKVLSNMQMICVLKLKILENLNYYHRQMQVDKKARTNLQ